MTDSKNMSRHQRSKHPQMEVDKLVPLRQSPPRKKTRHDEVPSPPARKKIRSSAKKPTIVIPKGIFQRQQSHQYFQHEVDGNGLKYLAALANFGRTDIIDSVDPKEVKMIIDVAQFVVQLSRPQREQLAGVLDTVVDTTTRGSTQIGEPVTRLWHIPVPSTPQQIRSTICEGRNSLFENLPFPMVSTIGEYAFSLPSECVKDLIAHGNLHTHSTLPKFEKTSRVIHGLGTCFTATELLTKKPGDVDKSNCLFISFWSDGFEPNYAKLNRGSAWIKTMTIHTTIPGSGFAPLTHVYPIAVGPKGNDHDLVEEVIADDLEKMGSSDGMVVYDGSKKAMTKVHSKLICILQDQPERRACCKLMLGNSTYHAQFGMSFDFLQAKIILKPCTRCHEQMRDTIADPDWDPPNCQYCTNWAVNPRHPLLRFRAPEDFPGEETLLSHPGYLPCQKLDFQLLKEVVAKAHTRLVSRRWTKPVATSYLRVHCLNTDAISEIKECADNCLALKEAMDSGDAATIEMFEEEKRANPKKYLPWEPPVAWNLGIDIFQYTEISMHQIFKGVVSTFLSNVQDWLSRQRKYEAFMRDVRPLTEAVRDVRVSWMRVEPYVGRELGGWVSENYLGFARIMPWAYSILGDLVRSAPYEEPDKDPKRWTKAENTKWLAVRGLDTQGTAVEVRARVASIRLAGAPPPMPPSGGPSETIEENVVNLFRMVSCLMGMKSGTEMSARVASRLIRLFLTSLYEFDENMKRNATANKQNQHFWLSAYNHLCLLNLPQQIANLGPLRNRWEGKYMGEGLLSVVKPTLTSPNRKNWTKNLMVNLNRERSMMILRDKTKSITANAEILSHLDDFSWYSTVGKLIQDFESRRPLSLLVVESISSTEPRFYGAVRRGVERLFYEFKFVPGMSVNRLGLVYFELLFTEEEFLCNVPDVTATCVVLPYVVRNADQCVYDSYYTAVDSEWRTLTDTLSFDLPHLNVSFTNDLVAV